jgi:hypothetical protein
MLAAIKFSLWLSCYVEFLCNGAWMRHEGTN